MFSGTTEYPPSFQK